MFNSVYKNKTVLITGHTGFKGSWLTLWLKELGANVIGISDKEPSEPCNFIASSVDEQIIDIREDISMTNKLTKILIKYKPDYIFHLAAQALVKESFIDPYNTFRTNVMGTANLLEALKDSNLDLMAIFITSDKVYYNQEWIWGYRENDKIGGKDPYSASKGMVELLIRSYYESFFKNNESKVSIGITRAGNVIGGGDWSNNRIVPDCVKSWSRNEPVSIRNPNSTRPWQHVLEPLSGYLLLGQNISEKKYLSGESYNFGPAANQDFSVEKLINEMSTYWNKVKCNYQLENNNDYEAKLLKLNCDKALADLKWIPTLDFKETVSLTINWYKEFYKDPNRSMYEFSISQIKYYTELARNRNISWANEQ